MSHFLSALKAAYSSFIEALDVKPLDLEMVGDQTDVDPFLLVAASELIDEDLRNAQRLYEQEHRIAMSRYWDWDDYAAFMSIEPLPTFPGSRPVCVPASRH